jgi:hypothetical protein
MQKYPENIRSFLLPVIYGIVAGLAAVSFLLATNFVFEHTYVALSRRSLPEFLIWSFIVIISTSLAVGIMLNYLSKEANGSGVLERPWLCKLEADMGKIHHRSPEYWRRRKFGQGRAYCLCSRRSCFQCSRYVRNTQAGPQACDSSRRCGGFGSSV